MKKTISKLRVILVALAVIAVGCDKNSESESEMYIPDPPLGKWQLVMGDVIEKESQKILGYTQNSIIYEFKQNNVLTVSGKTDNTDDYIGHSEGNHFYQMVPIRIPKCDKICTLVVQQIKINSETYNIYFGVGFFDSEKLALYIGNKNGTLVLVSID